MNMRFLFTLLIVIQFTSTFAQTKLNYKTTFKDGLYLSFEDFKQNKPSLNFSEIKWDYYVNHDLKKALIKEVVDLKNQKRISIDSIWGLCRDGKPFIKVETHHTFTDSAAIFASIQQFGKICYFEYEDFDYKELLVKSYNPDNGKIRSKKTEERKYYYSQPMMLNWENGKVRQMTKSGLLSFIKDDLVLSNTLKRLSEKEANKKLFQVLLQYNDRNAVYTN